MIWQGYFKVLQQNGSTTRKRTPICTLLKGLQRTTPKGKSPENTKTRKVPEFIQINKKGNESLSLLLFLHRLHNHRGIYPVEPVLKDLDDGILVNFINHIRTGNSFIQNLDPVENRPEFIFI